jgi:membrane protease YdiL (CAAX protease family)
VFFSSLLFAMVHPTGVPAWPALAAIGAMAALLTFQTRSLVPSIVMHAVHNGTLLLLNLLLFAG